MKKAISFIAIMFITYGSFGQVLKGVVKSRSGEALASSTVLVLDTKDSTMLAFAKTKDDGSFQIKSSKKGEVALQISNVGFEQFMRIIKIEDDQDFGVIYMDTLSKELAELKIKGARVAVEVDKDTINYNADAFKVQDNAMTEELLKKMPGIEVARDGSITAQGKAVTRLMVEGKEFFGKDPKIGTKNIPANAIKKIQVFDKKSDKAEFTGIDDGEEETTINLILKDDKKNLGFGRITAGGGVDASKLGKFNAGASYNTFKNGNQLSFLGNANNINQQGFSMGDFMSFSGMGRGSMGGGMSFGIGGGGSIPLNFGGRNTGLMRNISGGVNFSNKITSKTDLNGNYFYTNSNQTVENTSISQNSVNENLNYTTNQNGDQSSGNESHRLNVTLNSKINDKNTIRWVNQVNLSNNSNILNSMSESFKGADMLQNASNTISNTDGGSVGYSSQFLYLMKFAKKGRTLTTNLSLGINNSDNDGKLSGYQGIYSDSLQGIKYTDLNQISTQISNRTSFGGDISYTEPLNASNFLEFNYAYQRVNNDLDKEVFDINGESKVMNIGLSNKYSNDYIYNKAGVNYRVSKKSWNGNFGAALQNSELKGDLTLRNEIINKTFRNPVFNSRVQYNFTNSRSVDMSYNTSISEPSMTQLSPTPDNTNPLNIYVGNPNLEPQYNQRFRIGFRNFNQLTFTNFFANVSANYTTKNINNAIIIDEKTLVQTRTPINFGSNMSVNGSLNYGFRISPISTRFSVGTSLNHSNSQTLVNGKENQLKSLTNTNTVRADYTLGDNFNFSVNTRLTFNNSKYSQSSQLNPSYFNQVYGSDLDWTIPSVFSINSSLDYAIYRYANSEEIQRVPIWNASIYRPVFKNKRGEIRFSINDILGKNVVISQSASGNQFTEQRTNSLGRYVLATFTYNINGGNPSRGSIRMAH